MKSQTLQGLNLRRLRRERHLTQKELAGLIHVHPTAIALVENGHREPGNKLRLKFAQTLGVSQEEFFRPIESIEALNPSTEGYANFHSKAVVRWMERNPEKQRASYLARSRPDNLRILYECCHNGNGTKHNHHPFYDEPYVVIKLCEKCHRLWHQRLQREAKEEQTRCPTN